jgi:hypothetical protein
MKKPTPASRPRTRPQIVAGPTSIPGFAFCTPEEAERLLTIFNSGANLVGHQVTAAAQMALGVHMIRIGMNSAVASAPEAERDPVRTFFHEAVAALASQVLGVPVRIEVAQPATPADPGMRGEVIPPGPRH